VFHCAGVHFAAKAVEQDIEDWQRVMDVNLRDTLLVCSAAARHMEKSRGGAMVAVSSIATCSGFPRRSAYGTSKAAVSYLTRCLATEWGEIGIRINCIAPGYVLTPMAQSIIDKGHSDAARIENRTPLGRFAQPDQIARAAAFLLSDWASYITGAELFIDGGWSAFGGSGAVRTF
jgi:NAD(P)-dependent dehydrogenase (short-subunit alcohol dehydrogenase family)